MCLVSYATSVINSQFTLSMSHLCCDLNTISAVIEAMRWYMFVNGTMFQVLVHDLFEGDSLLFKVWIIVPLITFKCSFMDLINGTLATIQNLHDRELIRERYTEFGINPETLHVCTSMVILLIQVQSLGVAFPDDELLEYIKLFQEQSDIDCKLREASTMKRSGVSTEKGRAQVYRHANS